MNPCPPIFGALAFVLVLTGATSVLRSQDDGSTGGTRVAAAISQADTDPQRAAATLLAIEEGWSGAEIRRFDLELLIANGKDSFDHQLALWEVLTRWVQGLAEAHRSLPSGAVNILRAQPNRLAAERDLGSFQLPNLYLKAPIHAVVEEMKIALAKRRSAHDALCRALLLHPETAEAGFAPLAGLALNDNSPLDPLVEEAVRILKRRADAGLRQRLASIRVVNVAPVESEEPTIAQLSPPELLLCAAFKSGKPERWPQEWLALAKAAYEGSDAPKLEADAKLWLAPPAEFDRAAQDRLQVGPALGRNANHSASPMESSAIAEVMAPWTTRNLPVPLNGFLSALAKQLGDDVRLAPLIRYAGEANERGLGNSLGDLSRSLRDVWLGETVDQRHLALVAYDRAVLDSASQAPKSAQHWEQWLIGLARRANQMELPLTLLAEDGAGPHSRCYDAFIQAAGEAPQTSSQFLMTLLKARSYLDDTAGFPVISDNEASDPGGLPAKLYGLSDGKHDAARKALREQLAGLPSRTFGTDLIDAMLADDPPGALGSFLKKRKGDVMHLRSEQKLSLSRLLEPHALRLQIAAKADSTLAQVTSSIQDRESLELESHITAAAHGEVPADERATTQLCEDADRWVELTAASNPDRVPEVLKICLDATRDVPAKFMKQRFRRAPAPDAIDPAELGLAGKTGTGPLPPPQQRWLAEASRVSQALPQILEEAKRQGWADDRAWQNTLLTAMANIANPDYLAHCLDNGFFLKDAPQFRALRTSDGRTILGAMAIEFSRRTETRDTMLRMLADRQPATFGGDLVRALLQSDSQDALRGFILLRGKDFPSLSPEGAKEMSLILAPALRDTKEQDWNLPALAGVVGAAYEDEKNRLDKLQQTIEQAASVSDTHWSDRVFSSNARAVITRLLKTDRAKAKTIFFKAVTLLEEKQGREGTEVTTSNGWSLRSEFLKEWSTANLSLAAVGFACQLLNEDESGQLEHSGWSQYFGWGEALLDAWVAAGGDAAPEAGAAAMVEELQKELGKTSPALLALGFHDFVQRLYPPDQARVVAWAEKEAEHNPLARELAVAGHLFLSASVDRDSPEPLLAAVKPLPDQAPLWEHYRRHMQDDTLRPGVRLALAQHLCYRYPFIVDPEVALQGAALEAKELHALHVTHGYQLAPIVTAFCQRAAMDDRWKAIYRDLWNGWETRNTHNGEDHAHGRSYDPADVPVLAMLRLAAHAGDDQNLDALMARFCSSSPSWDHGTDLGHLFNAPAILILEGQMKRAESFLGSNFSNLSPTTNVGVGWLCITPAMEEAVDRWRAACKDPLVCAAGELSCLMVDDPAGPLRTALGVKAPGKPKRLAEFGKRLADLKDDSDHRLHTLVRWVSEERVAAALPLKQMIEDDVNNQKAKVANRTAVFRGPLVPQLAALRAAQGDFAMFREFCEKNLNSSGSNQTRQRTLSTFVVAWELALRRCWDDLGDKHAQEARESLRWLLATCPLNLMDEDIGACCATLLALHAAKGDMDELEQWRKSLAADRAAALEKHCASRFEVLTVGKLLIHGGNGMSPAERSAFVLRILGDPWTHAAKKPPSGWLPEVLKQKLLSAAEVLQQGEAIAKAWSNPVDANDFLAEIAARNDHWAEAAQFCELAANASQPRPVNFARLKLNEIACRLRAGETDKATAALLFLHIAYPELPPFRSRVASLTQLCGHSAKP